MSKIEEHRIAIPAPDCYIVKTLASGEVIEIGAVTQHHAVEYMKAAVGQSRHEFRNAVAKALGLTSPGDKFASSYLVGLIESLVKTVEQLGIDAERYRWLRDQCGLVEYKHAFGSIGNGMLPSNKKLDDAIDRARAPTRRRQDDLPWTPEEDEEAEWLLQRQLKGSENRKGNS